MVYDTQHIDGKWRCNCAHQPKQADDYCRHIEKMRNDKLQQEIDIILQHIADKRDDRDSECQSIDEVTDATTRRKKLSELRRITLLILETRGSVSSDDLHTVTNEMYSNDRIIGMVFNSLLMDKSIIQVGRKATIRRCAHGRSIGVYRLKPEEPNKEKMIPNLIKIPMSIPEGWIPLRDNPCRHQTKLME